jgi:sugar/nucleoside kinase (ribokinase family)
MDVISFGSVFLEVVFGHLEQLPEPGDEIFVDSFAFSCGGAITSAVAACRAGARAGLVTVLGEDLGSRWVLEYASREGVDTSLALRTNGPVAGISVVLNFDGDRAFVSHVPPRPMGRAAEVGHWLEILPRARPAWCYLHFDAGVTEFLRLARGLGTRVALDLSFKGIADFPDEVVQCARLADIFLPNERELLRLTGAHDLGQAIELAVSWCPCVVVKRGPAGAIVAERGRTLEVTDGLEDVVVRDRTGAGDAFAGAIIGNLAQGAGLLEAVTAGNAAGSEAVARLGAVGPLRPPGEEHRL